MLERNQEKSLAQTSKDAEQTRLSRRRRRRRPLVKGAHTQSKIKRNIFNLLLLLHKTRWQVSCVRLDSFSFVGRRLKWQQQQAVK